MQGLTAYGVLHDSARVGQGDAVLVMAAGGGVGTLAVQLAKLAGAGTVVGAAGSRAKLDLSLGADGAVDYNTGGGWVKEVLEATEGRGVDVALECVGGDVGARAYECLATLGRLVTYGAAGSEGLRPPDMWQLNLKRQTVGGYGGPWIRPADDTRAFLTGDSGTQYVWESQQAAAGFGIGGVPFYVIDDRYAVSGGQPAEV